MNWTVEGRGDTFAIVDQDDVEVATVPYTAETGDEPIDTAEGRRAVLLASAPDLLAALEGLLASHDSINEFLTGQGYAIGSDDWRARAAARAAIASAKGGQ